MTTNSRNSFKIYPKAFLYPVIVIILGRLLLPVFLVEQKSAFWGIALFVGLLVFGTIGIWSIPLLQPMLLWLKVITIAAELLISFWLFVYCFFAAYMTHPWPISAIQGPNTPYGWHGYEFLMRDQPTESVTDVYFQSRWQGWGDGSARILRFDCKDQTAFAETLQSMAEPSPQDISLPNAPSWWPQETRLLIKRNPHEGQTRGNAERPAEAPGGSMGASVTAQTPSSVSPQGQWIDPELCRTFVADGQWYG